MKQEHVMLFEEDKPIFKQNLVLFFNLKHQNKTMHQCYSIVIEILIYYDYLPQSIMKKIRGLKSMFAILFLDKILSRDVKVTTIKNSESIVG